MAFGIANDDQQSLLRAGYAAVAMAWLFDSSKIRSSRPMPASRSMSRRGRPTRLIITPGPSPDCAANSDVINRGAGTDTVVLGGTGEALTVTDGTHTWNIKFIASCTLNDFQPDGSDGNTGALIKFV